MSGGFVLSVIQMRRRDNNIQKINRKRLRDASNPTTIPDEAFTILFRLNKEAFLMVLEVIAPSLATSSIPQIIELAATLRFLAVGAYQGVIANDVNISIGRSTFSKVMWKVVNAMEDNLCPTWIKIGLTEQESRDSKSFFFEKTGMPGVIACVDGTHVRIVKPVEEDCLYYNRKGYFSLNVMIICDFKMRIRAVDACRPGSCHDSLIWRMSAARRFYQTKYQSGDINSWLLGDSGYGLEPFLLTPYKSPQPGSKEHNFNKKHCSARNIVERTIGNLKSRFRCLLSTSLHYSPLKVVKIVNVCTALHNICKHFNLSEISESDVEENDSIEDDGDDEEPTAANQNDEARRIRDSIATSMRPINENNLNFV